MVPTTIILAPLLHIPPVAPLQLARFPRFMVQIMELPTRVTIMRPGAMLTVGLASRSLKSLVAIKRTILCGPIQLEECILSYEAQFSQVMMNSTRCLVTMGYMIIN